MLDFVLFVVDLFCTDFQSSVRPLLGIPASGELYESIVYDFIRADVGTVLRLDESVWAAGRPDYWHCGDGGGGVAPLPG